MPADIGQWFTRRASQPRKAPSVSTAALPGDRAGIDPKYLYIGIEVAESFFVAITYTTAVVYRVTSGHQNPLQLILLGTMLELSYFVVQLPTGILADIASRKLCVIAGRFLVAAGFLMQGLSPGFTVQLIAQIPVGIGAALTFGAQEAWLADEAGETELTSVFLRATQLGLVGVIAGSILFQCRTSVVDSSVDASGVCDPAAQTSVADTAPRCLRRWPRQTLRWPPESAARPVRPGRPRPPMLRRAAWPRKG